MLCIYYVVNVFFFFLFSVKVGDGRLKVSFITPLSSPRTQTEFSSNIFGFYFLKGILVKCSLGAEIQSRQFKFNPLWGIISFFMDRNINLTYCEILLSDGG